MNAYESVINNPNLRVKIILPPQMDSSPQDSSNPSRGNSIILGYLENPFTVASSASWSDNLFGGDYAKQANDWLQKIQNQKIQTIFDTQQQYLMANIPSFSFSFYVIATDSNITPTDKVLRLYEAIYPTQQNDLTIKYHWGYNSNPLFEAGNANLSDIETGNPNKGTVIATIGNWFRAINMVITDVSIEYSDTPGSDGKPLWAKPTITIKPRRLPFANEFKQMFNSSTGNFNNGSGS